MESARTTDIRAQLQLGRLDETVEVIGAAPTLQLTSTTIGTTVTNADVQNLPLAGRNVLNFATLVSGSQVAGISPRQSTYQGMPGATINITLDGINNNSTGFKSGGTSFFATVPLRLDAIEEINVATAGLGADAGAEGAMNIRFVTKRGTNACLNGITAKELQKLISVRPGPSGSTVLFVDQQLIGRDGRANPEFLQSPTDPGELGEYVFLRGPSTFLTDLALLKDIDFTGGVRMSIWIEALNAFNTANFLVGNAPGPDVDINSTTFGQTTFVGAPRNVQIRVKLSF